MSKLEDKPLSYLLAQRTKTNERIAAMRGVYDTNLLIYLARLEEAIEDARPPAQPIDETEATQKVLTDTRTVQEARAEAKSIGEGQADSRSRAATYSEVARALRQIRDRVEKGN